MVEKRIDPRQQFSKWLARWTAIFWFLYILYVTTILIIEPNVADAVVYLTIIASFVMIVNVWAYTKNSVAEKMILSIAKTDNLKLSLKPLKKLVNIPSDINVPSNKEDDEQELLTDDSNYESESGEG